MFKEPKQAITIVLIVIISYILLSLLCTHDICFTLAVDGIMTMICNIIVIIWCFRRISKMTENKKKDICITGFKENVMRGGYSYNIIGYFTDDPLQTEYMSSDQFICRAENEHNKGDIIQGYDIGSANKRIFTMTDISFYRYWFCFSLAVFPVSLVLIAVGIAGHMLMK